MKEMKELEEGKGLGHRILPELQSNLYYPSSTSHSIFSSDLDDLILLNMRDAIV